MSRGYSSIYEYTSILAVLGALFIGGFNIILAINSMLRNDFIGAGVLMLASSLAFGFVLFASIWFIKTKEP